MINTLRALAVFAKAIDHGSFRGAAKALRISPSVVSHHISQLEDTLGVSLIYRSTRQLSLTRDGEVLIGAARDMVAAAEAGFAAVKANTSSLSGELHVTVPAVLARSPLATKIASFAKANPKTELSIDFSDEQRDVIADGIDVAIRMGWLRDSALKVRKLADVERVLLVSREYMRQRPTPNGPSDIESWDWIELSPVPLKPTFRAKSKPTVTLRPIPRLSVNNAAAIYELVAEGVGIAALPRFLAEQGLREGTIELLLPDWKLPAVGIYAVRPGNAPKTGLSADFVAALKD